MLFKKTCFVSLLLTAVLAHEFGNEVDQNLLSQHTEIHHGSHGIMINEQPDADAWLKKYGPQIDQPFSGPLSFSHLPYTRCLENTSATFDIAVLGMPFDTAVSYRPGARFGPYAIRSGSRRQREARGYTLSWRNNPYTLGSSIIDCGDVGPIRVYILFLLLLCALTTS